MIQFSLSCLLFLQFLFSASFNHRLHITELLSSKNYSKAIEEYNLILSDQKGNANIYYNLALAHGQIYLETQENSHYLDSLYFILLARFYSPENTWIKELYFDLWSYSNYAPDLSYIYDSPLLFLFFYQYYFYSVLILLLSIGLFFYLGIPKLSRKIFFIYSSSIFLFIVGLYSLEVSTRKKLPDLALFSLPPNILLEDAPSLDFPTSIKNGDLFIIHNMKDKKLAISVDDKIIWIDSSYFKIIDLGSIL